MDYLFFVIFFDAIVGSDRRGEPPALLVHVHSGVCGVRHRVNRLRPQVAQP
jgi:hypothetical protein